MGEVMTKSIGMKDYLAFTRERGTLGKIHIRQTKKFLEYYK